MPAPIALFVYNRPIHTRRTVETLLKNNFATESDLFIYSDAPKDSLAVDAVHEVRVYLRSITGFRSIHIVERDRNWGLANSIIDGVTSIVNKHGRIIVLEDDLVVSQYFLEYMNTALNRYEGNPSVMQVSGHMFPIYTDVREDAVFLPLTTSWGWATWLRAWEHFDPNSAGYAQLKTDSQLRRRFNLDGTYDYFSMLESQLAGRVDSWAVRWYLSVFIRDGLTLFPIKSLVANLGFDGSGVHCGAEPTAGLPASDFKVRTYPMVAIDKTVQRSIYSYLAERRRMSSRIIARLKSWLRSNRLFAGCYSIS